ncbi:AzlC family ABC transporter permease [Streptomyces lycii]|uniref:AzlC family ABC transporter permease n=1 Tax=Streptomyces lycii TaxID=2654337 RepID=A0ABQ7FBX2_9ACTN|nr:AzlC family ABC transporter permease [Streptomyces lycii]KAF4405199.1 AzlC family ABC transporter permease [Streptomyces lycii]
MTQQTGIRTEAPPRSDAAVVRDALGVGVAVGLSGFAFGVTAAGAGLTVLQTCALSLLVFTGASQFALVGALAAGGNPFTAAAGAFFLGVRNAFYGLRLAQLLRLPRALRPFAAQWVIDETTVVTLAQSGRRAARIGFAVTGATVYLLWNLTTLLGALGASALGDPDAWGLDAAGPAVFLALLAPMLRTAVERAVAGLAVVLVLVGVPLLPAGVPVLVSALAAPAVLALRGRVPGLPKTEPDTADLPDPPDPEDPPHPLDPADPGRGGADGTGAVGGDGARTATGGRAGTGRAAAGPETGAETGAESGAETGADEKEQVG